ncbi:Cytochrome c domain-containing protein [Rubrivivax sp. A210]|uniref:c-type cytochrome n=1 Tax=Rubrivivax sp. A210 TaxID=2772301 RepID=UPI0019198FB2|nr:c-type cytochrome [Rubrivivax sp. A210]CAD5373336.1 Cytochrome c domain-containing protein [Rubrivivax sp. A210]
MKPALLARLFATLLMLTAALATGRLQAQPSAGALRTGPGGSEAMRHATAGADELALGRSIFRHGLGEGGRPIVGLRFGGIEARGAAVACASCHRRSGLGAVEGTDIVPPVAGRFIFTDDPRAVVSMNYRNIKSFNQRHAAFSDEDFEAAVTQGRHLSGRDLSPIMPRFELRPAELQALRAYLRTLSAGWSEGVSATRLRLATVITPDVDPGRKTVFLETLRAAITQKNGNHTPGQRTMSSAAEMLFRSDRFWELDVWELSGPPQTWAAQLDQRMREQPVFALVSGLGAGEWGPVHAFCERAQTPCWFPSVDAPPAAASDDFYSVYFSAGVALEAEVLAQHLGSGPRPARVVQLHRGDAAGRAGAEQLRLALAALPKAPPVETREVKPGDAAALARALSGLRTNDALMLWWPAADWPALEAVKPPKAALYASARLAGSAPEAAVPAAWQDGLQLLYPYQLPTRRHATLFYFQSWLKTRKIELRDEVMQSEVYFALSYFAETMTDMIDNVHRDYLLERAENMLSLREGQKAEDEARDLTVARHQKGPGGAQGALARMAASAPVAQKMPRPMPGVPAQAAVKREGTTVYPRMSLAQGQRFASKGAYLVRFAPQAQGRIEALTDWIVP